MNLLIALIGILSVVAGYVTALLVPEEMKLGKRWFVMAAVFFAVLTALFWIFAGFTTQTVMALIVLLFILGTLVRARKH